MAKKRSQKWWDIWFLDLAKYYSTASKDPSTCVGSCIVDSDRRVISAGYNGFPKGIEDTEERLNDRSIKYSITVHAERNSLLFANRSVKDCTIYVWPFMPCSACASLIIQSGITRVVSPKSDNPRWAEDFKLSKQLFKEAKVKLVLMDHE